MLHGLGVGHGLGQLSKRGKLLLTFDRLLADRLLWSCPHHLNVAVRSVWNVLETVEHDDAASRGKEGRFGGLQVD
ncbi:hypothetical protein D3C81_2193690 [compost metagenome]